MTRLEVLYIQEDVVCKMGKSVKTDNEREYYKKELLKIREEIDNLTVCEQAIY